jgi:4-amino-4-deoxychorismate lyase
MNPPPLCFETICVQQGQLSKLLPYHQARLNRTREAVWPGSEPIDLQSLLTVPDSVGLEKHKCRVTYGAEVVTIEWEKYSFRSVQSLRLVEDNYLDYAFKYKNRTALSALHAQRGTCDDILIVKKGLITDTSYANVAFYDGTSWYTPAQPLLPGTQRAFLLDEGVIFPKEIGIEDLYQYRAVKWFNAMVGWQEGEKIDIENLVI